jgi:N-methylhydantoinase A/oxoprolinase/acetone carboxylase beta subunit
VQRSDALSPVAVLRLCGPSTAALPPLVSLPPDLAAIVGGLGTTYALAQGGFEIDGKREIAAVDEAEVAEFVGACVRKGLHCLVVCGVFSPVSAGQEVRVVQLIEAELERQVGAAAKGFAVTASHEVAGLGLLERESAAVLNSCVQQPLAERTVASLRASLRELELACALYLTQNDGTVAGARPFSGCRSAHSLLAQRTRCAAPRSSRAARTLWSSTSAGPRQMWGCWSAAWPRQSGGLAAEIGGVPVNFSIPECVSVGLGGGSRVRGQTVGPDSVGFELTSEADPTSAFA